MRKIIVSILFAATVLNAGLATTAAEAKPMHFHGGHHGIGGAGLVFGLAGAFLGAALIADNCVRYVPVYDAWGNYVGRRAVNIC